MKLQKDIPDTYDLLSDIKKQADFFVQLSDCKACFYFWVWIDDDKRYWFNCERCKVKHLVEYSSDTKKLIVYHSENFKKIIFYQTIV